VILVDSDVLIAHLRGHPGARQWLLDARRSGRLSMSVLSSTEIIGGMRSPERHEVSGLLASMQPLSTTDTIARRAGQLRRTYRRSHASIGTVDYVIAATAAVHGLELATLNTKHFPMIPDLRPPFDL